MVDQTAEIQSTDDLSSKCLLMAICGLLLKSGTPESTSFKSLHTIHRDIQFASVDSHRFILEGLEEYLPLFKPGQHRFVLFQMTREEQTSIVPMAEFGLIFGILVTSVHNALFQIWALNYWLVTCLAVCSASFMRPYIDIVLCLTLGTYMVISHPTLYLGIICLVAAWLHQFHNYLSPSNIVFKYTLELKIILQQNKACLIAFIFWLPISLPLSMRIRIMSFAIICSSLSLVHLFVAFRQLQPSNIIEVWLSMKDRVARYTMVAFGVAASILACLFLGILPLCLLLLL